MEIWKDVDGYEGIYQVSNKGRIKSLDRCFIRKDGKPIRLKGQILRGHHDTKGYIQIELKCRGKRDLRALHRLVALAFIPNPYNKPQLNHKDGNKENNCTENLEWCTCQENIRHAWDNDLNKAKLGEKHPNHKLTEEQVRFIKENYKPWDKEYGGAALAKKFNISQGPIQNIIKNKGWKHIK